MKFDKQPFSASGDYDARKPFDFQGEHIARGARFEWRRLGVSGRKLRQLWDNGFIVPAGSLPRLPAAEPTSSTADNSDPGDEANPSGQASTSEPRAEDKAKAEAEAHAKRVEAGKKAAEARKTKKAAAASAAAPAPEPSATEA